MLKVNLHQKVIIWNKDQKFLVLKRVYTNQKWDLAGGAVEPPETHEQGLFREIKEETGLVVTDLRPQYISSVIGDDEVYTLFIGYSCILKGEDTVTLSHEHSDFAWVTVEEFMNMDATPYLKEFVGKTALQDCM